jgi:hypothetical protein
MDIFFFIVGATGVGTVLYLVLVHGSVQSSVDQRLGQLEPLPPDLGKWVEDSESEEAKAAAERGLRREVRHLEGPSGFLTKPHLIKQVRYKNLQSGEVETVEPDQRVSRRRVKAQPQ